MQFPTLIGDIAPDAERLQFCVTVEDHDDLSPSWSILPDEVTYRLTPPATGAGYRLDPNCSTAVVNAQQVTTVCNVDRTSSTSDTDSGNSVTPDDQGGSGNGSGSGHRPSED